VGKKDKGEKSGRMRHHYGVYWGKGKGGHKIKGEKEVRKGPPKPKNFQRGELGTKTAGERGGRVKSRMKKRSSRGERGRRCPSTKGILKIDQGFYEGRVQRKMTVAKTIGGDKGRPVKLMGRKWSTKEGG